MSFDHSKFTNPTWLYKGQEVWIPFNDPEKGRCRVKCTVVRAAGDGGLVTNEKHGIIEKLVLIDDMLVPIDEKKND